MGGVTSPLSVPWSDKRETWHVARQASGARGFDMTVRIYVYIVAQRIEADTEAPVPHFF